MKRRSLLLAQAAVPLYWAMLLIALGILLRGHNEPGGGFIGGLVAAAASALLAIVLDPDAALRRQPLQPLRLASSSAVLMSWLPTPDPRTVSLTQR